MAASYESRRGRSSRASRVAAIPSAAAAVRSRFPVPGVGALSVLFILAIVLWLPPGIRLLVLAWTGAVVGATALPFGVVGLAVRLLDRDSGPR